MTDHDPHSKAADAVHEGRPVEGQYVNQGRGGVRISALMAIALVLTAIGFIAVYLAYSGAFSGADANDGDQAVDAAAFDNSGPPQPDAPTNATGEPVAPAAGTTPNVNSPSN